MLESAQHPPRFTLAMFLWVKPGGADALAAFRNQAAPLFDEYDLRVDRQLKVSGKGQLVGENRREVPHLVQLVSFPSAARFKAYVNDPRYLALAAQRDQGLQRMTVMAGMPLDISDVATPGQGPVNERLYGVGLVTFKPGGQQGMDTFNRRAQPLFARHGMHVELMLDVQQAMTPVGASQEQTPQRLVVFFLDQAAAMKSYVTDPEYAALAPLRDEGLNTYDFFVGTTVMP